MGVEGDAAVKWWRILGEERERERERVRNEESDLVGEVRNDQGF